MAEVESISHTGINVVDLKAAEDFYADILGSHIVNRVNFNTDDARRGRDERRERERAREHQPAGGRGAPHSPFPRWRSARRTSRSASRCAIVARLSCAFLPRHTPSATFARPRVK